MLKTSSDADWLSKWWKGGMKLYATWLIRPNQLCTVLMLVGVGKFLMAVIYLSVGWIPLMVILNPANSTDWLANWHLSREKTIPFWLQSERME